MSKRQITYSWQKLFKLITIQRKELILANIIAVFGACVAVPVPLLIPILVDEVLLDKPATALAWINQLTPESWHFPVAYIAIMTILSILLRFLSMVLNVWQTRQLTIISKNIIFNIRKQLLNQLKTVSITEYETLGSGKVASHLVTDLDAIDLFVSSSTSQFLVSSLTLIGTAIVLLMIDWQLALFILVFNPLVIWVTFYLGQRVKLLKIAENKAYQGFQVSLAETLESIVQLRANNRENYYIQRMIKQADQVRLRSANYSWKSDAAGRLSFLVFLFGFDIFRAMSMVMVLFSDLSIGQMLAVYAYLWFMMTPVQSILSIQYAWNNASAAMQRINQLFNVEREPDYPHQFNPFKTAKTNSIQFNNVSFHYKTILNEQPAEKDRQWILENINLDIEAGQKVAFVGASGGGKSTLAQLMIGLYQPIEGNILYDQKNIKQIGLDVVREHVAIVLQHPALFNDTIRNNLIVGRKIDDQTCWQALKIAQLESRIKEMPEQLDTLIGRNGVRLSGGQRQRLAIARMILSQPNIVILDEATSALDTQTEEKLLTALQDFLKDRTTLIIAHRHTAVKQADRVIVFQDGRIIQDGKPEKLLLMDGLYADFYAPNPMR